jgi:hypothetical protein
VFGKKKWEKMLIVGQVSSEEEKCEARFIAEVFIVGERFRYLARKQNKK